MAGFVGDCCYGAYFNVGGSDLFRIDHGISSAELCQLFAVSLNAKHRKLLVCWPTNGYLELWLLLGGKMSTCYLFYLDSLEWHIGLNMELLDILRFAQIGT